MCSLRPNCFPGHDPHVQRQPGFTSHKLDYLSKRACPRVRVCGQVLRFQFSRDLCLNEPLPPKPVSPGRYFLGNLSREVGLLQRWGSCWYTGNRTRCAWSSVTQDPSPRRCLSQSCTIPGFFHLFILKVVPSQYL